MSKNGRIVDAKIRLVVYDEPITVKTRKGESLVKAEILGCTTLIRVEGSERKFFTSVPLIDEATGEKIISLPLSGKNIFAPREQMVVNDGVKPAASAGAEKF